MGPSIMAPTTNHSRNLLLLSVLGLFSLVFATPNDPTCPDASAIVYSPFKPWFVFFNDINSNAQSCWHAASCVFIEADESRKQQFAATSLVMGLIPLTLKDIAWPERRIVPIPRRQHALVEMLVRALGIQPVVVGPKARAARSEVSLVARWTLGLRKRTMAVLIAANVVGLLGTYAALALAEIYSKRASLGCPFPVFVLAWYVVGLVPAFVHTGLSRLHRKRTRRENEEEGGSSPEISTSDEGQTSGFSGSSSRASGTAVWNRQTKSKAEASEDGRFEESASAIQGAGEWWVIQLIWAIYYIAGTLIYTSIMAVTVIELFVWVVVSFAVTGASKLLALFLCLASE